MPYTYIACQAFAGGLDMGVTQAGFKLIHKVEQQGGFGMGNCLGNRALLGQDWTHQATTPDEWEPLDADVLFGCPPCSGFSLLSRKDFRGSTSPINECMKELVGYGARVKPQLVIFESVSQAYKIGLDLMRYLRLKLEYDTQELWTLHHVLHNAASVGGAAIRRRYFWVASRVPFGIEMPEVTRVPLLDDVIGDLEGMGMSWERQPYRKAPSWWAKPLRSVTGSVDGHQNRVTPAAKRAYDLLDGAEWGVKENISMVARRYYQAHGKLPDSWPQHAQDKLIVNDFQMGYNQLVRWRGDRMARVITGGGLDLVMHPHEDRLLTHREVARIMGFPDDWGIKAIKGTPSLPLTWGKGVSVQCGEWIGTWAKAALDGTPGSHVGELTGDREYLIDCTEAYRAVSSER